MKIFSNGKEFEVSELETSKNTNPNKSHKMNLQRIFNIRHMDVELTPYYTGPGSTDDITARIVKHLANYRDKAEINEILSTDRSVPQELRKSILNAIENGYVNDWLGALLLDYEKYSSNVLSLLQKVSVITGQNYDELVHCADYHYRERDFNRLSNSLAELRAIIVLNENGFSEINLLRSLKKQRNVDIIANKDNKRFVIDVYHLASHTGAPKFGDINSLIRRINKVYEDKKSQLEISQKQYNADYQFMLVIIDEINSITALNSQTELESISKELFQAINCRSECGLILVYRGDGVILYPELTPD